MRKQNRWDKSFDACVELLQNSADKLNPYVPGGMDYKKLNVLVFCIVLPAVMGLSVGLNAYLLRKMLNSGKLLQ